MSIEHFPPTQEILLITAACNCESRLLCKILSRATEATIRAYRQNPADCNCHISNRSAHICVHAYACSSNKSLMNGKFWRFICGVVEGQVVGRGVFLAYRVAAWPREGRYEPFSAVLSPGFSHARFPSGIATT